VTWVVAVAAVVALHGKAYYAAPAYPPVIAAGAIACARALTSAVRRALVVAVWSGAGAIALVVTVPILPVPLIARLGLERVNRELTEFPDWAELTAELARLAPGTAVLTDSYATAAAVERYGPALGLPPPWSGANSWFAWGGARGEPAPPELLVVGYGPEALAGLCRTVEEVGAIVSPWGWDNRFDFPRIARRCRVTDDAALRAVWPRLRRFD
jgi:hypothetical protein